jgi:hypothetical protein
MTTDVKFEQLLERAQSDATFKQELLHDPKAVLTKELGANIPENVELKVLEETQNTHYLVIPKSVDTDTATEGEEEDPIAQLIARASQDTALKQELLNSPNTVIQRELGISIPDEADVKVVEETDNNTYLILPVLPVDFDSEELSEEQLEAVAGGFAFTLIAAPVAVYAGKKAVDAAYGAGQKQGWW